MHLKATYKKAEEVEAVLVDGKVVKMPFEFDTDEGWCDAYVPKDFGGAQFSADKPANTTLDPGKFEYDLVRLEGVVTVIFKEKEDDTQ